MLIASIVYLVPFSIWSDYNLLFSLLFQKNLRGGIVIAPTPQQIVTCDKITCNKKNNTNVVPWLLQHTALLSRCKSLSKQTMPFESILWREHPYRYFFQFSFAPLCLTAGEENLKESIFPLTSIMYISGYSNNDDTDTQDCGKTEERTKLSA